MKFVTKIFVSFFIILPVCVRSQTAPVTTAASVTNATPGSVTVPIAVTGFTDIGYCKLTLTYNTLVLTYVSAMPNSVFTTMSISNTIIGYQGTIVINWSASYGVTLPDLTHLVDIVFTYSNGSSLLSWISGISNCHYKKYAGGANIDCNDSPFETYYNIGGVSDRSAPVTMAPSIPNASPGTISVPIKVNNFSNVAAISLLLEYDTLVLSYLSKTANPTLGSLMVGVTPGAPGKKDIAISWWGLPSVTLPDGSTIVTLHFNYSSTVKGYSTLNWIETMENGPSCEYDDDANNPLIDSPSKNYYKNGIVFSSSQYAPQTWLPSIPNAVPAGSFSVPVYVSGFTNIKSFTQSFKYDPAVMSYTGFSQDPLLSGAVNVTDNAADANGKKKIVMTWTGSSPQSVPDGDPLVKINFNYISGASSLTWDTNPDSCRYNDVNGNAYYDLPKSTYYRNGMVASHPAPLTAAWNATGTTGLPVTIPVLVWHFSTIGAFNFTLDYDPGVLTYQSAALVPPLGGTFTPVSVEPGRLTLAWSGTAASLADSSNLVNLTFLYNGGNSPLAWYATGTACGSAEGLAQPALYDLPKANYYVNGNAGPAPVVTNFSASTTAPAVGATVIFSDLSTGSPDSWNWSFSPSTYVYVDSTGPNSKNPHLQFMIATPVSVTLIASRGMSSNVAMKSDYLQFGIPGLWTGNTSAAWNTGTNWDDQNVPSGGTDVMIPASAVNWPVISGDLVLGTQCRSITLAGSASLLTVNGNFTISDGTPLTFNGPGTIKVSGNWSNAGIFTCGNGTLEFTGAASGTIQTGTNPIASVNNYTRSTFTATFNDITGGTPGPTGDNTHTDAPIGFSFNYFGVAYTTLRISSNGWLSLDQSGVDTSSYHNEYLFTSAQPEATLAPWWDHLLADGSTSISYKTTGTAPNRVFTAEYSGILSYNSGSDSRLTFEVKLYESINVIEFYYGTVVNHIHNALESASIGIEDLNGGPGHFIEATTGSRTTGVTNLKSSANWPTVNYRFTPPPEKETFYNLVESKTSGALNIPGTIVVNGTLSLH